MSLGGSFMNFNEIRKKLEEILLSNDVEKSIRMGEEFIFEIIPELKEEKGFDQKNKYHCYDVWNHTITAIKNSDNDIDVRLVLLLHDIGKPFSCQEDGNIRHFRGHADMSAKMARSILKRLSYDDNRINELCFLIGNHATTIKEEFLQDDNIDLYKKLLYIQYCDASAYAPFYSREIINNLDSIRLMIESRKNLKH